MLQSVDDIYNSYWQEKIPPLQPVVLNADDLVGIGVAGRISARNDTGCDIAVIYQIKAPPAFQEQASAGNESDGEQETDEEVSTQNSVGKLSWKVVFKKIAYSMDNIWTDEIYNKLKF